jgi:glycosyltransferase involved in cell wall biosynthesis
MKEAAAAKPAGLARGEAVRDPVTLISVCIATHQRPQLLAGTLEALGAQTRPPDEIVVSDSSMPAGDDVVDAFSARHPAIPIQHLHSSRKALPWQRWWALKHSRGEIILFLDDDVTLAAPALETLERNYNGLAADTGEKIAGIGFRMVYDNGTQPTRDPTSLKERWLGTSRLSPGSRTPGGLTIDFAGFNGQGPVEVDVLWGGAMSFRREALASVPLGNLVSLYEAGIGRAEDAVLSCYARQLGKLFVLTEPFAVHPFYNLEVATPYATEGWRLGLTQTFGRAHTMRWIAGDWSAYKKEWWHLVALDLARCMAAVLRRPWQRRHWLRLGGACYGIWRAVRQWDQIPRTAK